MKTIRLFVVVLLGAGAVACGNAPTNPTGADVALLGQTQSRPESETTRHNVPQFEQGRRERDAGTQSPQEAVRVLSVTENNIEVEVASPGAAPFVVKVVAGDQGPTFWVDGRPMSIGQSDDDQTKPTLHPVVLAAVAAAIRVYAAYETTRACGPPIWNALRARRLTAQVWSDCTFTAAGNIASWGVATYVRGVGVTQLRTKLHTALKGAVTWSQLNSTLNKRTFSNAAEVAGELVYRFFEAIFNAIYNVFRQY